MNFDSRFINRHLRRDRKRGIHILVVGWQLPLYEIWFVSIVYSNPYQQTRILRTLLGYVQVNLHPYFTVCMFTHFDYSRLSLRAYVVWFTLNGYKHLYVYGFAFSLFLLIFWHPPLKLYTHSSSWSTLSSVRISTYDIYSHAIIFLFLGILHVKTPLFELRENIRLR